jgi:hypothetical protein
MVSRFVFLFWGFWAIAIGILSIKEGKEEEEGKSTINSGHLGP